MLGRGDFKTQRRRERRVDAQTESLRSQRLCVSISYRHFAAGILRDFFKTTLRTYSRTNNPNGAGGG